MKTRTCFCGLQRFLSVLSILCILPALISVHLHPNILAAEDTGALIADAGQPAAAIVIPAGATAMEDLAAEELQYHIEKVSGAVLPISSGASADVHTTILIATPDSYPELNDLFPEDIAWLKDTGSPGDTERYGDDGFAIRQMEDTIYIFGANARGTLNGVYDFIEENLGVLWIRADEDIGLVYDEMPTVTANKVNYAEKSPFQVRGWHLCSIGANGEGHSDPATEVMLSRNKLNAKLAEPVNAYLWAWQTGIGIEPFHLTHNISSWILESPIYDPAYPGYWNTDEFGNPLDPSVDDWETIHPTYQINYWDQGEDGKTLQTVIAGVLNWLENNPTAKYVGIGINDTGDFTQIPEQNEDFEFAPGEFVSCELYNYKSTVVFSFINKVARAVAEVYPDVTVNAYAYSFAQVPPECDIEQNVCIVFATCNEDVTDMLDPANGSPNQFDLWNLQDWEMKCNNIVTYNYYGCFSPSASFERPIADKLQSDMQYFAAHGFTGLVPEGVADSPCSDADSWAMNQLTFWLYGKLAWDPYADVEALIAEFCEKVYGDAGSFMLEYYYCLRAAWVNGRDGVDLQWNTPLQTYLDSFLLDCGLLDEMAAALNNAWNSASDVEKERIYHIRETFMGLVGDEISEDLDQNANDTAPNGAATEPVETTEPTVATKPAETTAPSIPTEPAETTAPSMATEPAESTSPSVPTEPIEATTPSIATEPVATTKPGSSDAQTDDATPLKIVGVILLVLALTVGTILCLKKFGVFKK